MTKKAKTNPAPVKKETSNKTSEPVSRSEEPARNAESNASRRQHVSQAPHQQISLLLPGIVVFGVFLAIVVGFGVQYYSLNTVISESATPKSAAPKSATPTSATPNSATPKSATPKSATPTSATPKSATPEPIVSESPAAQDLKKLELEHWQPAVIPNFLRNIEKNGFLLNFANLTKSGLGEFGIKLTRGGQDLHLDQLTWFAYELPVIELGGKIRARHLNFEIVINWVVGVDGNGLFITVASLFGPDPEGKTYAVVLMDDKGATETNELISRATYLFQHPQPTLAASPTQELLGLVLNIEKKWDEQFEKVFGLAKQNMPKEYQLLGAAAACLVRSSIHQRDSIEVQTSKEKLVFEEKFHFLKTLQQKLTSLDEQVFPLITFSRFNRPEVMMILNSWMRLITPEGEMANRIEGTTILMEKAQAPMMFQLIKELFPNGLFKDTYETMEPVLSIVAENTWKNSIGKGGLTDVKWLGHSRGLWQLEEATPMNSSSFELLCLLEDMARVMVEFNTRIGSSSESDKWAQRAKEAESARSSYWDDNELKYGDLIDGKIVPGYYSHSPVILGLPNVESPLLTQLMKNLRAEPLYSNTGLQLTKEYGAPVSTNFLLLQSFKRYSALSGPTQETIHSFYSRLKNNMIGAIALSHRREKSYYARYDNGMMSIGPKGCLEGTLVLPIMGERYDYPK